MPQYFSTLNLHSKYGQLSVAEEDQPKTALYPGPGMCLYQFCQMPFRLSGEQASLCGPPFASTYLNDILVYSPNVESHKDHLCQDFLCFQNVGLKVN